MEKEKRIIKNDFSLFKFLCLNCGKLLIITDKDDQNPDKMIISENCHHHFCEECVKSNSCPICHKQVNIIDDVENIKDEDRKEALEILADKFVVIYRLQNSLKSIKCNKKLVKTCISDCLVLCPVCFSEREHDHSDNNCEECVKQFEDCMFCKNCGMAHFKKNTSHNLVEIDNLQANYLDCCKENTDLLDENINKIEKDLAEIDLFLNKYQNEINEKFENIGNDYTLIRNEFNELNQKKIFDTENLVKNNIDYIDENKRILNKIKDEVKEYGIQIEKVEKDHISRHFNSKSYKNEKAKDHWENKYSILSKNIQKLNEIQSKYPLKKLDVCLYDNILDKNTKSNLSNYIDITFKASDYDIKDFHKTNLQFKIYEENDRD
jgi:hypothetical protein